MPRTRRRSRAPMLALVIVGLAVSIAGCKSSSPRVVLVNPVTWVTTDDGHTIPTDIIKIGPGAECYVYVHTSEGWTLSSAPVRIPEGWICAPAPPKEVR